jgi:hypothetical protein
MSQHELDQRPGCTQQGDCEISFRHHTELRKLELHLLRDPDRDGTSSRQLIRETGENFFQRPKVPRWPTVGRSRGTDLGADRHRDGLDRVCAAAGARTAAADRGTERNTQAVALPARPTKRGRALLRGAVCHEMLETYRKFCARIRKEDPMNDASLMTEGKALAQGPGALAGLKVIDLTRVLGGPYCTMVLSDHGAEVIKLEPPQGDETREWGPPFDDAGDASYFIGVNRNRESARRWSRTADHLPAPLCQGTPGVRISTPLAESRCRRGTPVHSTARSA